MTLTEAARMLSECGIEDARGEARLLFELVGKAFESFCYDGVYNVVCAGD